MKNGKHRREKEEDENELPPLHWKDILAMITATFLSLLPLILIPIIIIVVLTLILG